MFKPIIGGKICINGIDYGVVKFLGMGSYGYVYLIETEGNYYAAKFIKNKKPKSGIYSILELDIMNRLRHSNLLSAISIDVIKNTLVILMPCALSDLQNYINREKVTFKKKLKIMYDILNGIKFLHNSDILHLDLKPMNILIFDDNESRKKNGGNLGIRAAITDFGISLISQNKSRKYPNELVTITFRPPEILEGGRNYTEKTDIWSIGMIFYFILSNGKSIFQTSSKKLIKSSISKYLNDVEIHSTLQNDFKDIPQSYQSLSIDLVSTMLNIEPFKRPTINKILEHPLFSSLSKKFRKISEKYHDDIFSGSYIYTPVPKPKDNNLIYYKALDFLYHISNFYDFYTETVFLSCDIFHRIYPYLQLSNYIENDWPNIICCIMTCLLIATKMIENIRPEISDLCKYSGYLFTVNDILKYELTFIQILRGIIYPLNLFTVSNTIDELYENFKYTHNIFIYRKIDLNAIQKKLNNLKSKTVKQIKFKKFFKKTSYYKYFIDYKNKYKLKYKNIRSNVFGNNYKYKPINEYFKFMYKKDQNLAELILKSQNLNHT